MDIKQLICKLTVPMGVSGAEKMAADTAAELLAPFGEVSVTPLGSIICKVGEHREGLPSLLLDAHIDEIGMIVTYITDDGFLKAVACGGVDARVLPASVVTIYGSEKIKGVITSVPPHLSDDSSEVPEVDSIYIDTGFTKAELENKVKLGDRVLIENEPVSLIGGRLTSKALDDRCGCASVIRALELAKDKESRYNVTVSFSTGEEVNLRGAKTSAFREDFDEAIVVDVTFGVCHGESKSEYAELGKGPAIGVSSSLSEELSDRLIDLAKQEDIPYQLEVMGGKTGTNADAVSVSRAGVKAVTLSIPERYMHTPAEVIDPEDCENTARLISAFITKGRA